MYPLVCFWREKLVFPSYNNQSEPYDIRMIEIRMKFPLVAVFERVIFFESKMCQMFQSIYIDNICILLTYKKKGHAHFC